MTDGTRIGDQFSGFISVEYTSGFLDGVRLAFEPGFNCLLGESGTGKTTVVETLRYVTHEGEPTTADTKKLVQNNLKGGGVVRAAWRNEFGVVYTIERAWGQAARVFDAGGREVDVPVEQIVRADFYGQNAIQTIARDHRSQLDLLDGFAGEEMREVQREIDAVERGLRDNAGKVLEITRAVTELREEAHEASALEEKVKGMQPQTGADAVAIRAATAANGLREREAHAFATARAELKAAQEGASTHATKVARQLGAILDDDVLAGPNGDVMRKLASRLVEVSGTIERLTAELRVACETADAAIVKEEKALAVQHSAQSLAYAKLVETSQTETLRAKERDGLQKRLAKALSARKTVEVRQTERLGLEGQRRDLVARLSALREQRFAIRKGVAEELTAKLKDIRVTVSLGASDERYRELLAGALASRAGATVDEAGKTPSMRVGPVVDKLAEKLLPRELAALVLRDDVARLGEVVSETAARRVIDRLHDNDALYEIEIAELADVPSIKLKDGEEWKDVADVSHGQRGSAILPLLLLLGSHPIVIDQPEDNLFARFKSGTVAGILREVKARRQVIFVTHDPNLVVLPVADRVTVLASTGRRGYLHSSGTMVDRRETVEEMLDGGREAFLTRKEFYEH